MWKRLSVWFYKISSGWITLAAVLVFILFSALVLPGQASSAPENDGVGSPDMSIYYPAGSLYQMADGYGETGRAEYIRVRFTFDLVWPLVYTFFLVTTSSWIFNRIVKSGSPWRLVNLLPFAGMLLDYLENISTSLVMWRYPLSTPVIDWLAGIFTLTKWLLIGGSFASLLIGILLLIWQSIRNFSRNEE